MFEHDVFIKYDFKEVVLGTDTHLMDVRWMREFEAEWIKTARGEEADPYVVGYVTDISAIEIADNGIEIAFFANTHDRFHELKTFLPKSEIAACIDIRGYDSRPTIFVRSEWLKNLHLRNNSTFAMIDVAEMTNALRTGRIDRSKLAALRDGLDDVAARHPDVSFISFADSLLLKSNWTVGMVETTTTYTYTPEAMLFLFRELRDLYRRVLGLDIYGVFAQGSNEYYDDALLHVSPSSNHISLNSLGLPFAQIMMIEGAARSAIKAGEHRRHELYIDEDFYNSLRFEDYHDRASPQFGHFKQKMTAAPGTYFYFECDDLLARLKPAS
nr:hypothetical protein [Sphingomonas sp. Y57]